jgi:hypothetical protein
VDVYDSIMITNGRRTRVGPKAPPAAHDHWDFMAEEIDVYKEIKELDDLDSRAVTRYVIIGDPSSLSDGTQQQLQQLDDSDQEQEWVLRVNDTRKLSDERMMLNDGNEERDDGDNDEDGEEDESLSWQALMAASTHTVFALPEALTTSMPTTAQGGVMKESREEERRAALSSSVIQFGDSDDELLLSGQDDRLDGAGEDVSLLGDDKRTL